MLTRKFLSLLISVLLTLSPFASMDVAAAVADKGHCMMMDSDVESSHTMPACKHCNDDNSCNSNNCAESGCSTGHSLSLLDNTVTPAQYLRATHHLTGAHLSLSSRSSPPLLRPPV